MRKTLSRAAALLAAAITFGIALESPRASAGEFPDPAAFLREVRQAVRLDYELQAGFSYRETRRDVRISKLGRVHVGPLRTFEVYPSAVPGQTYKRLIAVDGRPLDPEELARRDRAHREDQAREAARRAAETPAERTARLRAEQEEIAHRDALLDDALAVFEGRFESRQTIGGEPVLVMTLTPRPEARVRTREGRWLKQFAGQVWIVETDKQIVRLDLRAVDDVTIGWGILGRVHEGSRFTFTRRRFENVWLPAEVVFDASGRTLLFRRFELDLTTTYSGYRRLGGARP